MALLNNVTRNTLLGRKLVDFVGAIRILMSSFPPLMDDIIQRLMGNNEGETLDDQLDPLIISPKPDVVEVNCITTGSVTLPKILTYDDEFEMSISFNSSVENQSSYLVYQGDGSTVTASTTLKIFFINGVLYFLVEGTRITYGILNKYLDGKWHTATIVSDGSTSVCSVDSDATQNCINGTATTSTITRLGSNGNPTPAGIFDGMLSNFDHTDTAYPLGEGAGLPSDVSGNGNHATAITATWIKADGIPCRNLEKGFRIVTQNVAPYIPALNGRFNIDDMYFSNWTGASPDDWKILNFSGSDYISENIDGIRFVFGGGTHDARLKSVASPIIEGHRYFFKIVIKSITGGISFRLSDWSQQLLSTTQTGTHTGIVVATATNGNTPSIFRVMNTPCDVVISEYTVIDLDVEPVTDIFNNPLTNIGGKVSNGAECSFVYADPSFAINSIINIVKTVRITGPGTIYYPGPWDFEVYLVYQGAPFYTWDDFAGGSLLGGNSNTWTVGKQGPSDSHPTATGEFPPTTGWPNGIEIHFSSWWLDMTNADDIKCVRRNHADWLARVNGTDDQVDQWKKLGADNVCHVVKSVIYDQGTVDAYTPSEYEHAVVWSGDDCGTGW